MTRALPDSVRRAVERQHPGLLNGNPGEPSPRPKFGNVRNVIDAAAARLSGNLLDAGEKFDSKLERDICAALRNRYGKCNVLRQLSILLPGGIRMVVDFAIIENGAITRLMDAKGAAPTRDWTNKAKLLHATHGLTVEIIRSREVIQ